MPGKKDKKKPGQQEAPMQASQQPDEEESFATPNEDA
jgi:hypothetical protein